MADSVEPIFSIDSLIKAFIFLKGEITTPTGQLVLFLAGIGALIYMFIRMTKGNVAKSEKESERLRSNLEDLQDTYLSSKDSFAATQRMDYLSRIAKLELELQNTKNELASERLRFEKERVSFTQDKLEAAKQFASVDRYVGALRLELIRANIVPPASFGSEILDGFGEKAIKNKAPQVLELLDFPAEKPGEN